MLGVEQPEQWEWTHVIALELTGEMQASWGALPDPLACGVFERSHRAGAWDGTPESLRGSELAWLCAKTIRGRLPWGKRSVGPFPAEAGSVRQGEEAPPRGTPPQRSLFPLRILAGPRSLGP